MSQHQSNSIPTTRRGVRNAACAQCGEPMELVMFEPAELYGEKEDSYLFRCTCGCTVRETVPRLDR